MVFERIRRQARLAWVCIALVAGCSGGGGGTGSGDLGGGGTLSVSTNSVTFTARQNGAPPDPKQVGVSISGGSVFVGISSIVGPISADFSITGDTTGVITITPAAPTMTPGTYSGSVTVRGCRDDLCNGGDITGSPQTINVTYTIQPPFFATPQSLTFNQAQGVALPPAQSLGISDAGGASYAWSASIVYQSGSGWLAVNGLSSTSGATLPASLAVSVNPSSTLGTFNAVIHLTGGGNTVDVPVSYTVSDPQFASTPAQLTFNAVTQGASPPSQSVTLSTSNSLPISYTSGITYGPGATGWLSPLSGGTAPGGFSVAANTTALAPGTYNATITLSGAAQNVSVLVTYTVVSPLLTFPSPSLSFVIDTNSLPAALTQAVSVGSTGGPLAWSAASSQPWVTVSPASGSSGSSVTLSLDPGQLNTLDPGTRSATITFSYTPPLASATSQSLAVSLDLRLPKIASVTPYVATSATSKEVVLRGLGFNNATGATLKFGAGATTSAFTVASDTEIRVTHPSLSAGAYVVTVANQLNNSSIVRSDANLVVVDAPVYAATTIAYPNVTPKQALDIVYDAERQALLVGVAYPTPGSSGEIFRIPSTGLAWGTPTSTLIDTFRDFALSIDGKQVLAVSGLNVQHVDAVTLALGTRTFLTDIVFPKGLALANDGNAVLSTGSTDHPNVVLPVYGYSVPKAQFLGLLNGPASEALTIQTQPGASADGSRVLISADSTGEFTGGQYNASVPSSSLASFSGVSPPSQNGIRPKFDRSATRILVNGSVILDSTYAFLGNLPAVSTAVALSPDGTRAYQFVSGTTAHAYDLTTSGFPEIGTGIPLPSDPGANPVMTVSPDGGTLFIAGGDAIVVVPAP